MANKGDPILAESMNQWYGTYQQRQSRKEYLLYKQQMNYDLTTDEQTEWNSLITSGTTPEDAYFVYTTQRESYIKTIPTGENTTYGVYDRQKNIEANIGLRDKPTEVFDTYSGKYVKTDELDSQGLSNERYVYTRESIDGGTRSNTTVPVSSEEAAAMSQRYSSAQERRAIEQRRFDMTVLSDDFQAKQNAALQAEKDYADGKITVEQKDVILKERDNAIEPQRTALINAKKDEQNSLNAIETALSSPQGEDAFRKSGLTDTEINDLRSQIAFDNQAGQVNQASASTGQWADDYNPANVGRRATGFEGLNNSAPFYAQFPTLNAITDFSLKNGYSPYGPRSNEAVARDAVHFNIFELNPPAARSEISSDGTTVTNIVRDQGSNLLGTFTIYPNDPNWLNLSHAHQWGNEQLSQLAGMANSVLGAVDTVQSLSTLFNNVSESAQVGLEQGISQRITRRIDTIDTYQGTQKLELTIPFVLFTRKDFLSDIFRPLMLLTAITYPKRLISGNIGSDLKKGIDNLDALKNKLTDKNTPYREIGDKISGGLKSVVGDGKTINEKEKALGELGGYGPFRYFVAKRPEYMSMRHASGLIYFPMCYITNISYEFKGPWYNVNGDPFVNAAAQGQIERVISSNISRGDFSFDEFWKDIKDIFNGEKSRSNKPNAYSSNPQIDRVINDSSLKQIAAYPSIAECKITIKNALPFYRDDWMQLYNGATDPQSLINVNVKQTGQSRLITPSGKNIRPPVGINPKDLNSSPAAGSGKPKGGSSATQANKSSVEGTN